MNICVKILENPVYGFDVLFSLPDGKEQIYNSVFCNRDEAERFADRVNRLGISAVHIPDIIEDALM